MPASSTVFDWCHSGEHPEFLLRRRGGGPEALCNMFDFKDHVIKIMSKYSCNITMLETVFIYIQITLHVS
jgi:hypothetical protein